jgi:hypothetical protein
MTVFFNPLKYDIFETSQVKDIGLCLEQFYAEIYLAGVRSGRGVNDAAESVERVGILRRSLLRAWFDKKQQERGMSAD